MVMQVKESGLDFFVLPATSYDVTGLHVPFEVNGNVCHSSRVTVQCLSGTAAICLSGVSTGPFLLVASPGAFDFPIRTRGLWIKGSGGAASVQLVAAIDPIETTP